MLRQLRYKNIASSAKSKTLMAQIQKMVQILAMEEMQEKEFLAAFSELTTLCRVYDQPLKSAGSGESGPAPSRRLGFKISSSDPPPTRYARRSKSQ